MIFNKDDLWEQILFSVESENSLINDEKMKIIFLWCYPECKVTIINEDEFEVKGEGYGN